MGKVQLDRVEAFVEVARQGRLSRAAEVLFVGQPALTVRLQRLEVELGASLFRRTRGGPPSTVAPPWSQSSSVAWPVN